MKMVDKFREKYTYINDETLQECGKDDPEFLFELIESQELIYPHTQSSAIEYLSYSNKEKYIDFYKKCTLHEDVEIAIAGYSALSNFYDLDKNKFKFILDYLKEQQQVEKRPKVLEEIDYIIRWSF